MYDWYTKHIYREWVKLEITGSAGLGIGIGIDLCQRDRDTNRTWGGDGWHESDHIGAGALVDRFGFVPGHAAVFRSPKAETGSSGLAAHDRDRPGGRGRNLLLFLVAGICRCFDVCHDQSDAADDCAPDVGGWRWS